MPRISTPLLPALSGHAVPFPHRLASNALNLCVHARQSCTILPQGNCKDGKSQVTYIVKPRGRAFIIILLHSDLFHQLKNIQPEGDPLIPSRICCMSNLLTLAWNP